MAIIEAVGQRAFVQAPRRGVVTRLLEDHSIHARSATTRPPTLDDVYLRLTGDRIAGKND